MRNSRTMISLAVASALGAASLSAQAAGPTVYGDIAVAFVYATKSVELPSGTPNVTGSETGYNVQDNVSLLGVKGEAAVIDKTKFIYDFNFILNIGTGLSPATHLSMVGMDGDFGTVTFGKKDNGLFNQLVDGGLYQTNFLYAPGMTSLQVGDAIKYVSKANGGFQYGVQAFDIGKSSTTGESTTNYTIAGNFAKGDLTFAAGYTSYSEHANGSATAGGTSPDNNQFGDGQNVYSGVSLKNLTGASVAYKSGKFGVVGGYDVRKPYAGAANENSINTLILTGSYAYTDKTTFVVNYSTTSQTDNGPANPGKKGNITTAMVSYAPAPALLYSLEIQSTNSEANENGLTGSTSKATGLGTGAAGTGYAKSNMGIAVGVTYNF